MNKTKIMSVLVLCCIFISGCELLEKMQKDAAEAGLDVDCSVHPQTEYCASKEAEATLLQENKMRKSKKVCIAILAIIPPGLIGLYFYLDSIIRPIFIT